MVAHCAKLPPALRRIVALSLIPMLLLAILALAWWPWWAAWQAQVQWRGNANGLLSDAKAVATTQPTLESQLAVARASELWSRFYVSAQSRSSTNLLHSDVTQLLAQAHTEVQSLTPIPASRLQHFAKLGVRVSVAMRIDQLKSFLASTANHRRLLKIERLVVVSPQSQSPSENPLLSVNMDIYGFELPPAEKASLGTAIVTLTDAGAGQ